MIRSRLSQWQSVLRLRESDLRSRLRTLFILILLGAKWHSHFSRAVSSCKYTLLGRQLGQPQNLGAQLASMGFRFHTLCLRALVRWVIQVDHMGQSSRWWKSHSSFPPWKTLRRFSLRIPLVWLDRANINPSQLSSEARRSRNRMSNRHSWYQTTFHRGASHLCKYSWHYMGFLWCQTQLYWTSCWLQYICQKQIWSRAKIFWGVAISFHSISIPF